jgi:hypothetical protein
LTGICSNDTVSNFVLGQDKIDLSAIDADASTGGNDAFAWGGQVLNYPVVQAHAVTWYTNGTNVELLADTDGVLTTAEFHITLTGVTSLAQTDFNTL